MRWKKKRNGGLADAHERIKSRAGFTMTELLLCTIIMLLSTALVVQTLELSIRQFNSQTRRSDAQMLVNTLAVAIQNQITHAKRCKVKEGTVFFTGNLTTESVQYQIVPDDGVLVMDCVVEEGQDSVKIPLADQSMYQTDRGDFTATAGISKAAEKEFVCVNLQVLWNGQPEAEVEFSVRPIYESENI